MTFPLGQGSLHGVAAVLVPAGSAHAESRMVRHTYGYFSGHVNADGSLVYSGQMTEEGYLYIAPDGTRYTRGWRYNRDGSPTGIIGHRVMGPVVNGKQHKASTIINHANRTYSQQHTEYSVTGGANAPWWQALDLRSSPPEVLQALQNGHPRRLHENRARVPAGTRYSPVTT